MSGEEEIRRLGKTILEILEKFGELELENVEIEAEELVLNILPTLARPPAAPGVSLEELTLETVPFEIPREEFPGEIVEVQIGATKSEGGSRKKVIKIGGEKAPPFYRFDYPMKNKPVVSMDVFDYPIRLPKPIRQHFEDVLEDPIAWAKKALEFEPDLITLHLISTSPEYGDKSPKEAAKLVEEIYQQIKDVPIIIGGSGDNKKDPLVLEAAAEVIEGERTALSTASLANDYARIARAAVEYGHNVIALSFIDFPGAKELNNRLMGEGLPKDRIIMDPTSAAVGYGYQYAFSVFERIRLAALKGEELLQMPISGGITNAWAAREAWLSQKKAPEWGPPEYRGPLWEATTGIGLMLAGCDLLMMLHPAAVKIVKTIRDFLISDKKAEVSMFYNWVSMKV
ncbi:MAG: CO dehydrogenase/acetyl-CoA synthase subunit delta [Candidatus Baldrarchaeia archaeon]